MSLTEQLKIEQGITAVIGGGGKTTFLRVLGDELAKAGHRVLLCTTTKILPFPELPNLISPTVEELSRELKKHRLVAIGAPVPGTGKLTAPELSVEMLPTLADYVLVEADGAAGRPMKAHAPHEPVIPAGARQTIIIVGASGFGHPIQESAHRPKQYASLAEASVLDVVTPEIEARVLQAEGLHQRVLVNQAETAEDLRTVRALARKLTCPVWAGSLRKGEIMLC